MCKGRPHRISARIMWGDIQLCCSDLLDIFLPHRSCTGHDPHRWGTRSSFKGSVVEVHS